MGVDGIVKERLYLVCDVSKFEYHILDDSALVSCVICTV